MVTGEVDFRTTQRFREIDLQSFIFMDEHVKSPVFVNCIVAQPGDSMMTLIDWHSDFDVPHHLSQLYYDALFTLPMENKSLVFLPNGRRRYVLDFRRSINWRGGKKTRKILRDPNFSGLRVAVNRNFEESLRAAMQYHEETHDGTWITEELIRALIQLRNLGSVHGVQLLAVELMDEKSGAVLAGCLGFGLGEMYHDFTMYTLTRDQRSLGTFLTKVLGAALQESGYVLWYWGNRVPYMSMFESRYGACEMDRRDFYSLWIYHRSELPVWSVDVFLRSGRGLIPHQ
jgi:Leu/Phe-tRNA-protein transferase